MLPRSKKFFQLPLSLVSFIFLSSILIQISDYRSYYYCIILFFASTASSFYYHLSNTSFHIQSISKVFLFLPTAVLILDFLSILLKLLQLKTMMKWQLQGDGTHETDLLTFESNDPRFFPLDEYSTVSAALRSPLKTPLCRYFLITFGPRVA